MPLNENFTTHPEYLETLEDYQNAPGNTIVGESRIPDQPFVAKWADGKEDWANIWGVERFENDFLAGVRRKVLYWPEDGARVKQRFLNPLRS